MLTIESPIFTSAEITDLVVDQDGNPVIRIGFDVGTFENSFQFYLEPLQARRLALALLRISQQGINREVELEWDRKEGNR